MALLAASRQMARRGKRHVRRLGLVAPGPGLTRPLSGKAIVNGEVPVSGKAIVNGEVPVSGKYPVSRQVIVSERVSKG